MTRRNNRHQASNMKLSAYKFFATAVVTTSCLVACGGGNDPVTPPVVAPAVVVPVVVAVTGANVLTVTAATTASRNGAYTVKGGRFAGNPPNPTDFGFIGNTVDGKFETEVAVTAANAVRYAQIWYYDANNVISFFGCGGNRATACTAVTFDAATQTATITNANWTKDGGTETLTVNGSIVIPK